MGDSSFKPARIPHLSTNILKQGIWRWKSWSRWWRRKILRIWFKNSAWQVCKTSATRWWQTNAHWPKFWGKSRRDRHNCKVSLRARKTRRRSKRGRWSSSLKSVPLRQFLYWRLSTLQLRIALSPAMASKMKGLNSDSMEPARKIVKVKKAWTPLDLRKLRTSRSSESRAWSW